MILPLMLAAPAAVVAPPVAAMDYQKKAVSVYADPADETGRALLRSLRDEGRFVVLEAAPAARQSIEAFVKEVGGRGKHPAGSYVLLPRLAFGAIRSTSPEVSKTDRKGGGFDATAHADLLCDYTMTVDVYDVATGRRVERAVGNDTLSRRFEYRYDERTSVEAIQYKAHELTRAMTHEMGRPPASAFESQAASSKGDVLRRALTHLKAMPLFRLDVQISGWSAEKDLVAFNLGRSMRVGMDDGFAITRDGRQIGYLKVRELGEGLSQAQPLYISEQMLHSDHVTEDHKYMWNHGMRVGYGYLAGSVVSALYAGELNVGPAFGGSEHYVTYDVGGVTNFLGVGVTADVGYAKKLFWRNWAMRLGGKAGFMQLNGVTGNTALPGVALATGLDYHFNENVLWGFDLDLAAYNPFIPNDGPNAGRTVYPIGPVARTGVTVLF